jgi:hypothetical protein
LGFELGPKPKILVWKIDNAVGRALLDRIFGRIQVIDRIFEARGGAGKRNKGDERDF